MLFIYMLTVVDQLPRLGKRDLICLLLFTCSYVVSVWRDFLFLWVLGMSYVILLWHSLSLPYNYLEHCQCNTLHLDCFFYDNEQVFVLFPQIPALTIKLPSPNLSRCIIQHTAKTILLFCAIPLPLYQQMIK